MSFSLFFLKQCIKLSVFLLARVKSGAADSIMLFCAEEKYTFGHFYAVRGHQSVGDDQCITGESVVIYLFAASASPRLGPPRLLRSSLSDSRQRRRGGGSRGGRVVRESSNAAGRGK